jgi:hypothetical protein
MKRTLIAAAWIAGATVPAALAAVFVFGCCVLPFHRLVHRALPLCRIALPLINGAAQTNDDQRTSTPAQERREPAKRIVTIAPNAVRAAAAAVAVRLFTASASTSYRSFIAQGAMRCDRDVGLHLLVSMLRI